MNRLAILAFAFLAPLAAAAAPAVEEGYFAGAGTSRLFFQKTGSGPAIVVPARLFLFEDLKPLADKFTVIAYDMRNRGRSDTMMDKSQLTIGLDVQDLEAVRSHFKLEKMHLVGYSYLGLMVALYASEHPEYVDRIVQLGPVPMKLGATYPAALAAGGTLAEMGADAAEVEEVQKLRDAGAYKVDPKRFCVRYWGVQRYRLVGNPANVERLGPGLCDLPNEWPLNLFNHFERSMASMKELDFTPAMLAKVKGPVLTIHGRKDRNAPYGGGREWAMRLPDARLVTLPEAAHNALNEYPDVVVPLMREFFSGRWPAGAEKVKAIEPSGS